MDIVDSGTARTRTGEYFWHRLRTPKRECFTYICPLTKNSGPAKAAELLEQAKQFLSRQKQS